MNLRYVFVIGLLVLLSACASHRDTRLDDPYWAPSYPQAPDLSRNPSGTIYNPATAQMLFQDKKALRVGDIITIVLVENTNASKTADTELKKDSSANMAAPTILGKPVSMLNGQYDLSLDAALQRQFKAESDSAQSNRLQGTISVTVHQVFPNGNLFVKGEKWISLNQGDEFIRVSGLVRPQDIDKDNQVPSTKIANAKIYYGGTGPLAESNQVGWLARFFNSGWWPF